MRANAPARQTTAVVILSETRDSQSEGRRSVRECRRSSESPQARVSGATSRVTDTKRRREQYRCTTLNHSHRYLKLYACCVRNLLKLAKVALLRQTDRRRSSNEGNARSRGLHKAPCPLLYTSRIDDSFPDLLICGWAVYGRRTTTPRWPRHATLANHGPERPHCRDRWMI